MSLIVNRFVEESEGTFNDRPLLEGYIYENVFSPIFFNTLKKTVSDTLTKADKKTYLTHGTTFTVNNESRKIISHAQNNREQNVIFDQSYEKEWFYQTKDTIKNWSEKTLLKNVSPVFYKCIKTLENLEPFIDQKDDWIFYRLHLNYLSYEKYLTLHTDVSPHLTNVKLSPYTVDHRDARLRSITFYLYDHIPGLGGELWTPTGFVYKPKANTAININGSQTIHGVTQNMNREPRMAFTVRAAHREDLFLPGHPSKYLYDVLSSI